MTSAGFPHSDISGSTPACDSPELFAANHVLHRLLTPRHSSCALSSLTTNLLWTATRPRRTSSRFAPRKLVDGKCHQNSRDTPSTRSRSKLHEGALTRRIPLTLVSLKDTLSRRRLLFTFQRTKRGRLRLSAKDLEPYQFVSFRQKSRSVERKGIEPLTPGLQSRCSPS
jgi:hypothetical protein